MSNVSVFAKEKKLATDLGDNVLVEVVKITPAVAARWLQANQHNRPLNAAHVAFLAREIDEGHWCLNGQALVIAENEDVLDGQHRLHAVIESGKTIESLVVYGIDAGAFKTIDTGKVRSGQDVLSLNFPNNKRTRCSATATAARWCILFARKSWTSTIKVSNTDILDWVNAHSEIWAMVDSCFEFPREQRQLAPGPMAALMYQFDQRNSAQAEAYVRTLNTGVDLTPKDPAYILRNLFAKDAQRLNSRYTGVTRMKMIVKGWSVMRLRREATPKNLALQPRDPSWIEIL